MSDRLTVRDGLSSPLVRPGDLLQSSASRLAEWVLAVSGGGNLVPYEVRMAALEAQSAVDEWTDVRRTHG